MPPSDAATLADVRAAAPELLGLSLRPDQERATAAVLAGRDVLLVAPTGSGKSAVFQLAGAMVEGPVLVVGPLLALEHDQRRRLEELGLGASGEISSSVGARERADALAGYRDGSVRYLFTTPEQLVDGEVLDELRATPPALVVLDEAHLMTTWGEGFRPAFLGLGAAVRRLGGPPVLALTATASPTARRAIVARLGLRDPEVIVRPVVRPEISLSVRQVPTDDDVVPAVAELVQGFAGTGLVYVAQRGQAERLAEQLDRPERPAVAYHGGFSARRRDRAHARFLAPEPCVVVATVAFGLGIDKPDVRFVVHADPPEDLDAYYQEVGRAGRDGDPADGVVVWTPQRRSRRAFFGGTSSVGPATVARVWQAVRSGPVATDALGRLGGGAARAWLAATVLAEVGAVSYDGEGRLVAGAPEGLDVDAAVAELLAERRRAQRSQVDTVRRYLEGGTCRWRALAGHLGQAEPEPCGHCDECRRAADAGAATGAPAGAAGPYAVGARVAHETFGPGLVIDHDEEGQVTVLFDAGDERVLSLEMAEGAGQLHAEVGP